MKGSIDKSDARLNTLLVYCTVLYSTSRLLYFALLVLPLSPISTVSILECGGRAGELAVLGIAFQRLKKTYLNNDESTSRLFLPLYEVPSVIR